MFCDHNLRLHKLTYPYMIVLVTKAIVSNPLDFLVEFSANKF